jgi:sugar fermentation stimulation protein A
MEDRGLYLLLLELESGATIKAGRLSASYFRPGFYVYVGRARHGLCLRVQRHLRGKKKIFWHIDYFARKATIREIWIKPGYLDECRTVSRIKRLFKNAEIAQKKFGASDCRCQGHLLYMGKDGNMKKLWKKLGLKKIV